MATRRGTKPEEKKTRRPPATTPEGRENQLIAASVDLAEEQIRTGVASSQVVTHFLKLGSSREKLEQQRLAEEVKLLQVKAETLASQARTEELMKEALNAFKSYSGGDVSEAFDD